MELPLRILSGTSTLKPRVGDRYADLIMIFSINRDTVFYKLAKISG